MRYIGVWLVCLLSACAVPTPDSTESTVLQAIQVGIAITTDVVAVAAAPNIADITQLVEALIKPDSSSPTMQPAS